jgi:hypothetical protein
MPEIPTPRASESGTVPIRPAPPSVGYAQRVLWLQASIWALGGAIGGVIGAAAQPPTGILLGRHWAVVILAVGWSAFAIGMAAVKMLLADRLGRGRSQRARRAVITVELAMTGFGVLWFSTPYSGPGADLAGFGGGCLSLAAAVVLMRRRAREYAECDAVNPEVTDRGPASGRTSFWRQSALSRA